MAKEFPLSFTLERAEGERNRATCAFRPVLAIPILVVAAAIGGAAPDLGHSNNRTAVAAGGLLVLGPALMIVFRQKYPRWWFDWNLSLLRFMNRVAVYLLLLRDEYPSTDEEQAVHLDVPYPDAARDLNQWLPLVKWLLALPHYVALIFVDLGVLFGVIAAWFSLLFTGRYPPRIYDFVVGALRWNNRVAAYAFLLVTDVYPPFGVHA